MTPYDPESIEAQADENVDDVLDGEVTVIADTTAGDFYNTDVDNPEREMIRVTVQIEQNGDTEVFEEGFSMPDGPQSFRNPRFRLGRYIDRYGEAPREGHDVQVVYDENGFLAIELDD